MKKNIDKIAKKDKESKILKFELFKFHQEIEELKNKTQIKFLSSNLNNVLSKTEVDLINNRKMLAFYYGYTLILIDSCFLLDNKFLSTQDKFFIRDQFKHDLQYIEEYFSNK